MRTVRQPEDLGGIRVPLVVAIGFFDGVHRGHQAVLGAALAQARERAGQAWALTFEPHPLQVLRPRSAPLVLTPLPDKEHRIAATGLDGCIVMPFTAALAEMEPEAFVERMRRAMPALAGITVGARWSFGRGARGDARLLRRLARPAGLTVRVVRQVRAGGVPVSSTGIREAVADGRMEDAARWLGRPFSRRGTVVRGRKVGRTLGFPAANLRMDAALVMPPAGVYAARVHAEDSAWGSAVYLGSRPTFGPGGESLIEAHLLDFNGDLYGREIEVEFLHRVRDDRRFGGTAELQAAIVRDLADCRAVLARASRAARTPRT